MILERVITGGQSGADLGGLCAARRAGIPTGGTAPRLFMAEHQITTLDGQPPTFRVRPCPDLHDVFGLVECPDPAGNPPPFDTPPFWEWLARIWPPRTRANAANATGTCWLGTTASRGFSATEAACRGTGKPFHVVAPSPSAGSMLIDWIEREEIRVLNVAGNRESVNPGIGDKSERFLVAVFEKLKAGGRGS